MLPVTFYTFGCKLNQCETESIAAAFAAEDFPVFFNDSDFDGEKPAVAEAGGLVVINTCTVTSKAEQKARRLIRAALKKAACVIVTGCYAELDRQALENLAADNGKLLIIPGSQKSHILTFPARIKRGADFRFQISDFSKQGSEQLSVVSYQLSVGSGREMLSKADSTIHSDISGTKPATDNRQLITEFRSRPFIKIQEGCNNACTFCRVRLARGKTVSVDSSEVLGRLAGYEERGMAEAVLSGVNICQYRQEGAADLAGLLHVLLDGTHTIALRLSSLEPDAFTPALDAVLAEKRIRPHFHLSVQSGCDEVLQRMGRRYSGGTVRAVVQELRRIRDDPFIACDIIAGFPGETEEDFAATFRLCEELDFAWIHAFPYSPRPGTSAAAMNNQVQERKKTARVKALAALAQRGKAAYIDRWTGRPLPAVVTGTGGETGIFLPVLTENYIKVNVVLSGGAGWQNGMAELPRAGRACMCRISGRDEVCGAQGMLV
ncbi:MAG: tRNA (N(6)-L-threonylcarbamoyladenosine(37)-C(2))-methylthiotransferase MtaB [Spirochaetaceae bacterium]|nr:tRNA (N(6)-L-threonylcarbamoyladenosine(37)-C(2))-methylthiotransferase MtaB [Spirochaetaceae bacterium]